MIRNVVYWSPALDRLWSTSEVMLRLKNSRTSHWGLNIYVLGTDGVKPRSLSHRLPLSEAEACWVRRYLWQSPGPSFGCSSLPRAGGHLLRPHAGTFSCPRALGMKGRDRPGAEMCHTGRRCLWGSASCKSAESNISCEHQQALAPTLTSRLAFTNIF